MTRRNQFVRHTISVLMACGLIIGLLPGLAAAQSTPDPAKDKAAFERAAAGNWIEVFADSCTGDWKEKWHLDGEVGTVTTGPEGMTLSAGPADGNDAHHVVLWTKDSFEGDVKIEYDVTRLDKARNRVTILYIQATGSGAGPYAKDISQWNELRKVPAMRVYFNHMNTYHISYAANPGTKESYIRGRRYMPERQGLRGTELKPDYFTPELFATGVKHHITVVKKDRDLYMRVENSDQVAYFHMTNATLPVIAEGRIGLRHMYTRSSRYTNFRVSVPGPAAAQDLSATETARGMVTPDWKTQYSPEDGGQADVGQVNGRPLAFPGAQGFGRFASGGRGGKVVFVTNLNDSGPGSLRHALENESGPRTVIFRTGGIIELKNNIAIKDGCVTIAGQTAPGGGITLKNATIVTRAEHIIMRGLRIRPGDDRNMGAEPSVRDGIAVNDGSQHVIIDHCSFTWSVDENGQSWRGTRDITFSNNLFAEGLNESIHAEGRHSKGLLIGPDNERISVYRNVFADNHDRNVRFVGPQRDVEMINNYIFNCDWCTVVLSQRPKTGRASDRIIDMRIINNYFDSQFNPGRALIYGSGMEGVYVAGNEKHPSTRKELSNEGGLRAPSGRTAIDQDAILPATQLLDSLKDDVGARWPQRDAVDRRILNEVVTRAAFGFDGIPDSPRDVGGYPPSVPGTAPRDSDNDGIPNDIEPQVGGNGDRADAQEVTSQGYTRLELYINGIISGDFGPSQ